MSQPDPIEYQVPATISSAEAAELYVEAGWMETPDREVVETMLRGTFAVSAAYHQGRLIGFMRSFSDGVSDAYMLDLVVRREYRRRGVGRKILEHLADYLKSRGIDWILCIGAPGTELFYSHTRAEKMDGYTPYHFSS